MKALKISLAVCLLLLSVCLPTTALARNSGDCGEGIRWDLDGEGILTISGAGAMYDYDGPADQPWYGLPVKTVIVKTGVTRIGSSAFYCMAGLTAVSLPDTLTEIGHSAFCGTGITAIALPAGLKHIESYGLWDTPIRSLTLPCSLVSTGLYALPALAELDFEAGFAADIPAHFLYGTEITRLCIPEGVKALGNGCFDNGCLETLYLPATLRYIGEYLTGGSASVKICYNGSMEDFAALLAVQPHAFPSGSRIRCMDGDYPVPEGSEGEMISWKLDDSGVLTLSGTGAMPDYSSDQPWRELDILSVVVEEGITYIGARAFCEFREIRSVTLPDSVTGIGAYAFYGTGLSQIDWPENILAVGAAAFAETEVTSVTLPATLRYIGQSPFFRSTEPQLQSLEFAEGFTADIPEALLHRTAVTELTVPEGVKALGSECFACDSLVRLVLPSTLEALGGSFFGSGQGPEDICYSGTKERFYALLASRPEALSAGAMVHCADGDLSADETVLLRQPEDLTLSVGENAHFSIAAAGTALTCQWQYSADNGATWFNSSSAGNKTAALSFTPSVYYSGRLYRCIVTGSGGSVCSDSGRLTVK